MLDPNSLPIPDDVPPSQSSIPTDGETSETPSETSSVSAPEAPASRPRRRWVGKVAGGLLAFALLLGSGFGWLYWASRQIPAFYEEAARQSRPVPAETLRKTAARVTRQTREVLEREIEDQRGWDFEITPDELNAWLVEELPGLIGGEWPKELADPRVAFEDDLVLVGAMVSVPPWEGVASLSLRPSLSPPRTVLLEIESLKVGKVPVPVDRLVAEVPQLLKSPYLRKNVKTGKYVLRVPLDAKETESLRVETLEITPLRIRVTGH